MSDGDLKEAERSEKAKKAGSDEEDNKKREAETKGTGTKETGRTETKEEEQKAGRRKRRMPKSPKMGSMKPAPAEDLKEYREKTEEELKRGFRRLHGNASETELLNLMRRLRLFLPERKKKPGINPVLLLVEYMARIKNITASIKIAIR